MEFSIEELRQAAFEHLHLIYVRKNENGTYRLVKSEMEGKPVLVDYISFHLTTSMLRVKDIGSNIIYLLNPVQFKRSYVKDLMKRDHSLEGKLRIWYPFLWDEWTEEDREKYRSTMRQLKEYANLDRREQVEGLSDF